MCSELQVVKITETFFMAFFFYAGKGTDAELRLNEKQIKTALKKWVFPAKNSHRKRDVQIKLILFEADNRINF